MTKVIDFLLTLYENTYRANFSSLSNNWIAKNTYNAVATVTRWILRRMIKFMSVPNIRLQEGSGIVVSVSSFPKRFLRLRYMLISVLRQSIKPELIVVNLTQEECPNGLADVPDYLRELERYGIEYRIRSVNLRPHNKYYYVMQEYPQKNIITLDDDIFYRCNVLERLVEIKKHNPGCVCANQVRYIKINSLGDFVGYNQWALFNNASVGHHLLALGVGGVLYPAGLLREGDIMCVEGILHLCLNADDLWLKAHEIIQGVKVATGDFTAPNLTLNYGKSETLSNDNVIGGRNNQLWLALDNEYSLKSRIIHN